MSTPYVTPQILVQAPTGISWNTIPNAKADARSQLQEQTNICWRATHTIDAICSQPLRATVDTEEVIGPDFRLTLRSNGTARLITSRWPITQVIAASVTSALAFPITWNIIPVDHMRIEETLSGEFGLTVLGAGGAGSQAIDIAPGFISWNSGRNGFRLRVQYINGWSHAAFTASVAAAASVVPVDDCTGFAGAVAQVYDGGQTETVTVASTDASVGPGNLTLNAPLAFEHPSGVVISSLPSTIQWATILTCVAESLTRGGMAITMQNLPGMQSSTGGGVSPDSIMEEVKRLIAPYRRVI